MILETNEEYISLTYWFIRSIDSSGFLSSSLDSLVKTLVNDGFKILKEEFPDKWEYLNKKLAYPYEFFNGIDDDQKSVNNFTKEDFFSKLKNKCPDDDKIKNKRNLEIFIVKNREELTKLYSKSDVIL